MLKNLSNKLISGGFWLALLLLLLGRIAAYLNLQKLNENRQLEKHTYKVLNTLQGVSEGVKDLERGRRGYILSQDEFYLKTYESGIENLKKYQQKLNKLIVDNQQKQRRNKLNILIAQKIAILQESLTYFNKNKSDLKIQIKFTEKGKNVQNNIEEMLDEMQKNENNLLEQRTLATEGSINNNIIMINMGYAFSFGILIIVYFLLQNQINVREKISKELEKRSLMLDLANNGIIIRTIEGQIEYWNQGAEKLYGWTKIEIRNQDVHNILKTVFPTSEDAVINECLSQGYWQGQLIQTRQDGAKIIVESYWTVQRDIKGKPISLLEINNDITEQKQAEESKKRSEAQFQYLVDANIIGIAKAEMGKITEANDIFLQMIGYTHEDLLAGEINWQEITPPEYIDLDMKALDELVNSGNCKFFEKEYMCKNGDRISVLIGAILLERSPLRWIAFIVDQRAQKQAELSLKQLNEQLEIKVQERTNELNQILDKLKIEIIEREQIAVNLSRSEKLYRTLIQNLPKGAVLLFDRDLRYLIAAGKALIDVGINQEQLEGKTMWEAFTPEICELIEPRYLAVLAGETQVFENYYEGHIFRIQYIPIRNDQDEIFAGMIIVQDITLEKQAEQILIDSRDNLEIEVQKRTEELIEYNLLLQNKIQEYEEAKEQLELLTTELKRSNQELEQFAYVSSHDLQEPLRAVTSYTQMIAKRYEGKLDEKADKYIYYIVDGATRMQQLIQDLLAYSRVGRYDLKLQTTDMNFVVEQVLKDLKIMIEQSYAQITIDVLPTITVDKVQITQLFQNLISNSIKYRQEVHPKIHISATEKPEEWLFAIADNGIGIESQYFERIFVIFQRLHTRKEYPGTGIGLALCYKIVQRHYGKIWLESQLNQGTTFYFTLPKLFPQVVCD